MVSTFRTLFWQHDRQNSVLNEETITYLSNSTRNFVPCRCILRRVCLYLLKILKRAKFEMMAKGNSMLPYAGVMNAQPLRSNLDRHQKTENIKFPKYYVTALYKFITAYK